jgi:hypothetical protein
VCTSGGVYSKKLRVEVPAGQRQAFIDFLQVSDRAFARGARYVGGTDSSDLLTISFHQTIDAKKESFISIWAENRKPSAVFDFYFETCNTSISLKAYWAAAQRRVREFRGASLAEMPSQ